jgi:rabenosyn-5
VRKRLTDSFIQYESAARRIRDLTTASPAQSKLQKAVYQQASNFLHLNMLPLKSLPKILKHASPHGAALAATGRTTPQPPGGRSPSGALAAIRFGDRADTGSQHGGGGGGSVSSAAALEGLEAEERDLRTRLGVLEEQKFLVLEMLAEARRRRRFEEQAALGANVEDLSREIDSMRARVLRLEGDFRDVYEEIGGAVVV